MFVSITLVRLKSPIYIPKLIRYASPVFGAINKEKCLHVSSSGLWLNHYTMTIWNNEEDMMELFKSPEHRAAMAQTQKMASNVKFYKAEMEKKPSWKEAKRLLHAYGHGYEIKKQ